MDLKEALIELRKSQKRKFEQSVDLIINLKGLDLRKDNISAIITMPHIVKEKKVCGFLTKKSELVRTITPPDFQRYKDKDSLKELVKSYDFFISHISLMPAVATTLDRKKSELVRTITPPDFQRYKDKDSLKELVKSYDFFISHISLMPAVATT